LNELRAVAHDFVSELAFESYDIQNLNTDKFGHAPYKVLIVI